MCGGVTAYTACKRSAVRPGQWIVLPGAGGGLGHLAVQYAKAMGMRVIAVDAGEQKGKLCRDLGAEEYLDFTQIADLAAEVLRITKHGAHGVVVTAAAREGYAAAPHFLRPGGTMVAVGLPKETDVVAGAPPILLALKRLNIVGSVTGTLKVRGARSRPWRVLVSILTVMRTSRRRWTSPPADWSVRSSPKGRCMMWTSSAT